MEDKASHISGLPPLLVAIISIASAAAMLVTFHCIVSWWCYGEDSDPGRPCPRPAATDPDEDILSRIETSITELIPSIKYTKDIGMVLKTQDKTCAVCLCDFTDGEPVRVLPECLHPFHVPCIDMWLYSQSSCPVCRTNATPARFSPPDIHQP